MWEVGTFHIDEHLRAEIEAVVLNFRRDTGLSAGGSKPKNDERGGRHEGARSAESRHL